MKKLFSIVLIAAILCFSTGAYAAYYDVPSSASYAPALNRLSSLGIIGGDASGLFNPTSILTRDQFAKMIVIASGQDSLAQSLMGSTIFPDISSNGWSSGYINAAVKKGLLNGMSDGKFHPSDPITFAQVCTILVRALGYTDQDVQGLWPKNYIQMASSLNLTSGINLTANQGVPRWAAVQMVSRLLDTNVKPANGSAAAQTFGDSTGITSKGVYTNYSDPQVVHNFNPLYPKVGNIDLSGLPIVRNTVISSANPPVNKSGETIGLSQIKENDVIYLVSNASGSSKYILDVDNKVSGSITGFLPNKMNAQTIQIDSKNYTLTGNVDFSTLNSFNIGDTVTLLLGYDGKVANVISPINANNSNYAFVINTGRTSDSTGTSYNVKLMFTDGTVATFKTAYDMSTEKGHLVTFAGVDTNTVSITDVSFTSYADMAIDKSNRLLGSSYVAGNAPIFDLISNDSGSDAQVDLIDFKDLPNGTLPGSKVLYMSTTGDFQDIRLMVVSDLLGQQYGFGMIDNVNTSTVQQPNPLYTGSGDLVHPATIPVTNYTYSVNVGGKDYSFKSLNLYGGVTSIVRVKLVNGSISDMQNNATYAASATKVDAIDAMRIKVNGTIYWFRSDVQVFFRDSSGNTTKKGISDISSSISYSNISIYLDNTQNYGGKVAAILVQLP
ncbi:MAG: S-layer homology domain-containing protein [Bacillota bacterium]|nr:S-layer homology domain-containing protein [Bacillota bacterium]